jgi:hypothetical protein
VEVSTIAFVLPHGLFALLADERCLKLFEVRHHLVEVGAVQCWVGCAIVSTEVDEIAGALHALEDRQILQLRAAGCEVNRSGKVGGVFY